MDVARKMMQSHLRSYSSSDGYYTVSLPEGWKVDGFKCSGITAQDISNPARGLSYLSKLHEGFVVLPTGVTPESYLENYMPQDFSLGGNDVRDMRIIDYEEPSFYNNKDVLSLLSGVSLTSIPTSTKAMRCSFTVNGIPAEGSFVIRTKDLYGYGTQIDYLLGNLFSRRSIRYRYPNAPGGIQFREIQSCISKYLHACWWWR